MCLLFSPHAGLQSNPAAVIFDHPDWLVDDPADFVATPVLDCYEVPLPPVIPSISIN